MPGACCLSQLIKVYFTSNIDNQNPNGKPQGYPNPPQIADQSNGFSLQEDNPTPNNSLTPPPNQLTNNVTERSEPSIMTLNCNGIYKTKSNLFIEGLISQEMKNQIKNHSISLLCDTHLTNDMKRKLIKSFKNHYILATENERRRAGTAVLFRKEDCLQAPVELSQERLFKLKKGRETDGPRYIFTKVKLKHRRRETIIISVYGPTKSNKERFWKGFSNELWRIYSENKEAEIVLAGDLNVQMDNPLFLSTKAGRIIYQLMWDYNLLDSYRSLNSSHHGYTHWSHRGDPSRLDYILTNINLNEGKSSVRTISGAMLQSDHEAISLQINKNRSVRETKTACPRPFNDKVLQSGKFRKETEHALLERLKHTALSNKDNLQDVQANQPSFVNTLDEVYSLIDQVVRPIAKNCEKTERSKLNNKKKKLIRKYNSDAAINKPNKETINSLEETRNKLREIETAISRISSRQTRFKLIAEGDRITPFFLNRFKEAKPKRIEEIQTDPDNPNSLTTDRQVIQEHVISHFKNALESNENPPETLNSFLDKYNVKLPTISEEARQAIEQQPNRDEIQKAIEHLNNNSAPGLDGITSRLVKFLNTLIPDLLCTAITKEMNGRDGKTLLTRIRKLILIEKRDSEKKTIKKTPANKSIGRVLQSNFQYYLHKDKRNLHNGKNSTSKPKCICPRKIKL